MNIKNLLTKSSTRYTYLVLNNNYKLMEIKCLRHGVRLDTFHWRSDFKGVLKGVLYNMKNPKTFFNENKIKTDNHHIKQKSEFFSICLPSKSNNYCQRIDHLLWRSDLVSQTTCENVLYLIIENYYFLWTILQKTFLAVD